MKNLLGFLIITFIAITFISCDKDYICTCTAVSSAGGDSIVTTSTITDKKSVAEDKCSATASMLSVGTTTATCELE